MTDWNRPAQGYGFPPTRPDIHVAESQENIDQIDSLELRWWFVIPRLGDHTMCASYDAATLELSSVTDMVATVPARIHQVDCVEIRVNEWSAWKDWPVFNGLLYGKIEEREIKWIAVANQKDRTNVLSTFLDAGFEKDWGKGDTRKLYDDGRYQLQADGSYRSTGGEGLGAGAYNVTIGVNTFSCLRVLDADLSVPEGGELVEAYVERRGRTVLLRRYEGRFYRGRDLVRKYPDNLRIVINDVVYVHSDCTGRAHETITNTALALHP